MAEIHIGHRFTRHTCSQQATWNRHTNEQQVVFLAGIITENQRQQSEIPGRLILFSTNKTFYPLHSTWPCFFSLMLAGCRMSSTSLSFRVFVALTGLKGYDREKMKMLVRRSLPPKKILRNSQAKFTLQHLLCVTAFTLSLISHHQVNKCSHYRERHNKPGTKYLTVCVY